MNIPSSVVAADKFSCIIKNWKLGASHHRVWILETSCAEDIGK